MQIGKRFNREWWVLHYSARSNFTSLYDGFALRRWDSFPHLVPIFHWHLIQTFRFSTQSVGHLLFIFHWGAYPTFVLDLPRPFRHFRCQKSSTIEKLHMPTIEKMHAVHKSWHFHSFSNRQSREGTVHYLHCQWKNRGCEEYWYCGTAVCSQEARQTI